MSENHSYSHAKTIVEGETQHTVQCPIHVQVEFISAGQKVAPTDKCEMVIIVKVNEVQE